LVPIIDQIESPTAAVTTCLYSDLGVDLAQAHDFMALSYASGFMCGYIGTGNLDHNIDHGVPSGAATSTKVGASTALGYLA
jgi:hypothetical protein